MKTLVSINSAGVVTEIDPVFKAELRRLHCYKRYINNVKRLRSRVDGAVYITLTSKSNSEKLMQSFIWRETSEGFDYWCSVSNKMR